MSDELSDYERMTVAATRLAEAWVEFWASVTAYGASKTTQEAER